MTGRMGELAFTDWLIRFCCTGFGAAGGGGGVLGMIRAGGNWLTAMGRAGTLLATALAGRPVGVISVGRATGRATFEAATSDGWATAGAGAVGRTEIGA